MSLARSAVLGMLLCIGSAAWAAPPGPAAQAEIAHLLAYLGDSGCTFQRNGSWHSAAQARAHLAKKRDYLQKRSLVASAEEFIERAATASSVTGEAYLVRCAPAQPVASAAWLYAELRRYRSASVTPGG